MNILNWFKKTDSETPSINEVDSYIGVGNSDGILEPYSPTWIYIENHIKDQIDKLRQKNDNPTISYEKTQVIRGQIKELKRILDLPKDK